MAKKKKSEELTIRIAKRILDKVKKIKDSLPDLRKKKKATSKKKATAKKTSSKKKAAVRGKKKSVSRKKK